MSWARYDDAFHEHPKVAAVLDDEPAALALHLVANTWTHRNRRGGLIPRATANRLVGRENAARWAAILVTHGLWHSTEDGWAIHDWEKYAPDGEQQRQAAHARWGRNASAQRAHTDRTTDAVQNDASRAPEPAPVPVPESIDVPSGTSHLSDARSGIALRVFEAWRGANGHPQARLTDARRRLVQTRLREGYSEEVLTHAVLGMSLDPWEGRVLHNDLSNALRDGAHVEKFAAMWENGPPKLVSENPHDRRIREFGRGLEVIA